jgi:hypothetical protein
MPKATATSTRLTGPLGLALLAALLGSNPAQAESAAGFVSPGVNPNTFIVGHPASPTWTVRRANGEHPAVLVSRRRHVAAIDSNSFVVQPPASARWTVQTPSVLTARTHPLDGVGTRGGLQGR